MFDHRRVGCGRAKLKPLLDDVLGNEFVERVADADALEVGQTDGAMCTLEVRDVPVGMVQVTGERDRHAMPFRDEAAGRLVNVGG